MSVTLKWIELHELGDYLKKGWTEVELRTFASSGKFLIVSPEEPASEPAKVECKCGRFECWECRNRPAQPEPVAVECPNCGEKVDYTGKHVRGGSRDAYWICRPKPAQPEPVANLVLDGATENRRRADLQRDCDRLPEPTKCPKIDGYPEAEWANMMRTERYPPIAAEMPEAVKNAVEALRDAAAGEYGYRDAAIDRKADALESLRRTHAAQPAKVRMTEELRMVLGAAEQRIVLGYHGGVSYLPTDAIDSLTRSIAAVRAQAAETGKVTLPKLRELLRRVSADGYWTGSSHLTAALAELSAAEGRK